MRSDRLPIHVMGSLTWYSKGFSVNKDIPTYKVEDQKKVLTIEEMNA